ncbi:MAG: TIGR04086 family membrane protein [Oscillospiraceae bacterium]|nr:TIGR04086 family membrane protein [Oscillospiraceae bacterium]
MFRFRKIHSRKKKTLFNERIYYTITGIISGLFVTILCLLGFSYLLKTLGSDSGLTSALSNIALVAGCFAAGYTATRHKRKNGLKTGLIVGVIIYGVVYLIGIFTFRNFVGLSLFTKLLIVITAACIGGVLGVNSQIKPKKF